MEPSFTELYPDIVAAGSLAAALERTAAELGLDLGEVQFADPMVLLEWASIPHVLAAGRPLWVRTTPFERVFGIDGRAPGGEPLRGNTPDLSEVVRAAAAWRGGASLREVRQAATFVNGA
ncbi:hypothetical protein [Cryptosporangium arvum]|uniref:hypothetical protein n=1 Tax=Cryptosporangium arvum TaxID=80871 RepID=UPI0004B2B759|nr:hypothetical protein [Cryptosporangium arvum]